MKITKDAMYPRLDDTWTIYLKNAITNPAIWRRDCHCRSPP